MKSSHFKNKNQDAKERSQEQDTSNTEKKNNTPTISPTMQEREGDKNGPLVEDDVVGSNECRLMGSHETEEDASNEDTIPTADEDEEEEAEAATNRASGSRETPSNPISTQGDKSVKSEQSPDLQKRKKPKSKKGKTQVPSLILTDKKTNVAGGGPQIVTPREPPSSLRHLASVTSDTQRNTKVSEKRRKQFIDICSKDVNTTPLPQMVHGMEDTTAVALADGTTLEDSDSFNPNQQEHPQCQTTRGQPHSMLHKKASIYNMEHQLVNQNSPAKEQTTPTRRNYQENDAYTPTRRTLQQQQQQQKASMHSLEALPSHPSKHPAAPHPPPHPPHTPPHTHAPPCDPGAYAISLRRRSLLGRRTSSLLSQITERSHTSECDYDPVEEEYTDQQEHVFIGRSIMDTPEKVVPISPTGRFVKVFLFIMGFLLVFCLIVAVGVMSTQITRLKRATANSSVIPIGTATTTQKGSFTQEERLQYLLHVLTKYSPEGTLTEEGPSTLQFRALAWLVFFDPLTTTAEDDTLLEWEEARIVQRYTMAVLMYSLKLDSFEFRKVSECKWASDEEEEEEEEEEEVPEVELQVFSPSDDYTESQSGDAGYGGEGPSGDGGGGMRGRLRSISCDDSGWIVAMDVDYNCMQNTDLPQELMHLTHLTNLTATSLNCRSQSSFHKIPSILGFMPQLTHLDLSGGTFRGLIPDSFENLVKLQSLDLSYTLLGDSFFLGGYFDALVKLDLQGAEFRGPLPWSIGALTTLQSLDLSNVRFEGEFPATIRHLGALKELVMEGLDWTVHEFPGGLSALTELTRLSLRNCNFGLSFPAEIGFVDGLTKLDLNFVRLGTTVPTSLGKLTHLEHLVMQNVRSHGMDASFLWELTSLTHLNLFYGEVEGTISTAIGRLSDLEFLELSRNRLTGTIPSEIGKLNRLTYLELSYNELGGSLPLEIGNLRELVTMNFCRNSLTGAIPTTVGNLELLDYLELCNNPFNGTLPTELGLLRNLRRLNLKALTGPPSHSRRIDLGGTLPSEIGLLNMLDELIITNTQISGTIPKEFGQLVNLSSIELSRNNVTGSIPTGLESLRKLQELNLYGNRLDGTIPWELGSLTRLTELDLGANKLWGSIPTQLGDLTRMKQLRLKENQLTGTIPTELGHLVRLNILTLDDNQLTGDVPATILDLGGMDYLSLENNLMEGPIFDTLCPRDETQRPHFVECFDEYTPYPSAFTPNSMDGVDNGGVITTGTPVVHSAKGSTNP